MKADPVFSLTILRETASEAPVSRSVPASEIHGFLITRPDALKNASERVALENLIDRFIAENEDPSKSPNFRQKRKDEFGNVLRLLNESYAQQSDAFGLKILKVLKILSRKVENRVSFNAGGVCSVLKFVQNSQNHRLTAEGANVLLNICYEKDNVNILLQAGGIPTLVSFLQASEPDVQANAAGAIQSICFQESGRYAIRDTGAIPSIISLLSSTSVKVQTRAVGALHNMSSDPDSIRIIRRKDGIAPLISLLRAPNPSICGSAAGALQNVSREVASRQIIRNGGAVFPLTDLLFGSDIHSQVCASGALLNILGPEMGSEEQDAPRRTALKRLLSLSLVVSMTFHCIYTES
mmetsp:Transcript_11790/g.20071  ORF Transcript_11790/g.20071 Transcript_11790/m.20071 type:complete len:352 (-) Transcript_11790:763-1818(-)